MGVQWTYCLSLLVYSNRERRKIGVSVGSNHGPLAFSFPQTEIPRWIKGLTSEVTLYDFFRPRNTIKSNGLRELWFRSDVAPLLPQKFQITASRV